MAFRKRLTITPSSLRWLSLLKRQQTPVSLHPLLCVCVCVVSLFLYLIPLSLGSRPPSSPFQSPSNPPIKPRQRTSKGCVLLLELRDFAMTSCWRVVPVAVAAALWLPPVCAPLLRRLLFVRSDG